MTKDPDLVILLVASYRATIARLLAAMKSARLDGVRPVHGFVIRAVAAESPTINRLAELLDTSKQAASKLADGMEREGLLERFEDPDDRRRTRLRLARKGKRVMETALATSAEMERELERELGAADVRALRRALTRLLARDGSLEDALARRARPVW